MSVDVLCSCLRALNLIYIYFDYPINCMCLTVLLKAGKHSLGFKLIFHFPPPASKTSDLIDAKEAQLALNQRFSILAAHSGIT